MSTKYIESASPDRKTMESIYASNLNQENMPQMSSGTQDAKFLLTLIDAMASEKV